MKDFWINMSVTKREEHSKGKFITYYRCGCKICDKCWFCLENESCMYGGPYAGYIENENENQNG